MKTSFTSLLVVLALSVVVEPVFAKRSITITALEPNERSCLRVQGNHTTASTDRLNGVIEWVIIITNNSSIVQNGTLTIMQGFTDLRAVLVDTPTNLREMSYLGYLCSPTDTKSTGALTTSGYRMSLPTSPLNFTIAPDGVITLYVGTAIWTTSPQVANDGFDSVNSDFLTSARLEITENRGAVTAMAKTYNRSFKSIGTRVCGGSPGGASSINSAIEDGFSCWGYTNGQTLLLNGGRPF